MRFRNAGPGRANQGRFLVRMESSLRMFFESVVTDLNQLAIDLCKAGRHAERDAVLRCSQAFGAAAMRELDRLAKAGAR